MVNRFVCKDSQRRRHLQTFSPGNHNKKIIWTTPASQTPITQGGNGVVQTGNTRWSKKSIYHDSLAIDDVDAFREAGNAYGVSPSQYARTHKPRSK